MIKKHSMFHKEFSYTLDSLFKLIQPTKDKADPNCETTQTETRSGPDSCLHPPRPWFHLSGQEPKHLIDTIVVLNARIVQFALQRAQVLV